MFRASFLYDKHMYYNPHLLNQTEIFPNLAAILNTNDGSVPVDEIEEFLYRTSSVIVSHGLIYQSEKDTAPRIGAYINQLEFPENKRIAISSDSLTLVYSQIPLAIGSLVCMQNLMLPIFHKLFKLDKSSFPPSSLSDAMKSGIENYGFNQTISDLFKSYWQDNGKYLRDVRNIDQHFKYLITNTFFEYKSAPGVVLILLPDNPEIKSPSKFTYENSNDAHDLIIKSIEVMNDLVSKVLSHAGYTQKAKFTAAIGLTHAGDLTKEEERTLGLMISTTSEKVSNGVRKVELDAMEMKQVIPKEKGGGNVSVRKLLPDKEVVARDTIEPESEE